MSGSLGTLGSLAVILELDDAGFTTRVERAGQALGTFNTQISTVIVNQGRFDRSTRQNTDTVAQWITALGQAKGAVENLTGSLTSLPRAIVDINAKLQNTIETFKGLSSATTEVGKTTDAMRSLGSAMELAANTGLGFKSLADTLTKFRTAAIDPLHNGVQTLRDFSNAVEALGGNSQTLERVGLAVQQMASKGMVSMEELRRQLGDALPGAINLVARGMGLTVGQLTAQITKGTVEAQNAIQRLADQMDLAYGGTAQARLGTYKSQVAQLETQMQRLAMVAGGTNQGAPEELSFFHAVARGLTELNEKLRTPEVTAYAITLNNSLRSIVESTASVVRAFEGWGGTIARTGATVLEAYAGLRLLNSAMTMTTALLTGPGAIVATLGANFQALRAATIAVAAGFASVAGTVAQALAPMGAAIAAAVSRFIAFNATILNAASGMSGLAAVAVEMVTPMVAFTASLAILAVPAAVLVGIGFLISKMERLKGIAELTGDALQRIRQGDITETNEQTARGELDDLIAKRQRLIEQGKLLAQAQTNLNPSPRGMQDIKGALGSIGYQSPTRWVEQPSEAEPVREVFDPAMLASARARWETEWTSVENEIVTRSAELGNVASRRAADAADRAAQAALNAIKAQYINFNASYVQNITKVDEELKRIQVEDPNNKDAISEQKNQARSLIDTAYGERLRLIQSKIAEQTRIILSSDAQTNGQQIINARKLTEGLTAEYEEQAKRRDEVLRGYGQIGNGGANKEIERQQKAAATMLQDMEARLASVQSKSEEAMPIVAKMTAMIAEGGKLQYANPEQKQQLLDLSDQLEAANIKLRNFQVTQREGEKVQTGLLRQQEELQGYLNKINDPAMPEGQRRFVELSFQMDSALRKVAAAAGETSSEFRNLQAAVAQALNVGAVNQLLAQVDELAKKAQAAKLQALPEAQRNAIASGDRNLDVTLRRLRLQQQGSAAGLSPEDITNAIARDQQSQATLNDAGDRKEARAGARAAAPGETAVTQLTSRLAQLREELNGNTGTFAKWNAAVERSTKWSDAQKAEILGLARQVDTLDNALKRAHAAQTALNNLDTNLGEARDRVAQMDELAGRGRMLDIEKSILDYRVRQNKEVARVAAQVPTEAKNAQAIAADITAARQKADTAITSYSLAEIQQRLEAMRTETLNITKGIDDTTEKRRAAGMEEIAFEQSKTATLIAQVARSNEERSRMEDVLGKNIAAKRLQLERQTENTLQKNAREWSDYNTQIGNFGGQMFDKLGDAVSSFTGGTKTAFTDMANWVIQEIERMGVKMLLSPVLKALGDASNSSGGSGSSGWLGTIISAASTLFGGGAKVDGGAGMKLDVKHGGGISGFESSMSRMLPASVLSGAPRFHTGGIASDEVPTILQKGEGVFTAGQMAIIGRMNSSYQFVEQSMAALQSAASAVPSQVAPVTPYGAQAGASGQGRGMTPVINLHNQSGMQMNAQAAQPKFDGEKMILDVVLKHAQQPGQFRNVLKGVQ